MRRFDFAVLRVMTRIAWAIQRVTGVISYRLAHQILLCDIAIDTLWFADYWKPTLLKGSMPGFMLLAIVLVLLLHYAIARLASRSAAKWEDDETTIPAEVLLAAAISNGYRQFTLIGKVAAVPWLIKELAETPWTADDAMALTSLALPFGLYFALVPPLPRQRMKRLVLATNEC